jgi:3-oxoacyl-[acyl-carrier-protein] synthase II
MKIYINGIGNVSPQQSWDCTSFLEDVKEYDSRMLQCLEPEVDPGLDEKYLRRMSRLIRLGWIAAKICLEDSGNQQPDAIITGSGWGSVRDSEKFLLSIYHNRENLLPPTPFIQSTHNAVGAQIAMLLNNYSYNMAYSHGTFAFEQALVDSIAGLKDGDYSKVLAGGFDEITPNHFTLTGRLNRWRRNPVSNLRLFDTESEGTVAGEGITFFLLQPEPSENTYAEVKDVMTLFSTGNQDEIVTNALSFLEKNGLEPGLIDLVFAGFNGDSSGDAFYREILGRIFPKGVNLATWKHLCGEYHTSTAFATWAAANVMKRQALPGILRFRTSKNLRNMRNVLIYNHYKGIQNSFILLSFAG